jgi:HK97 family phage portal protein
MTQNTWYNAERVTQPGSVVLKEWNAARQERRTMLATMQPGMTGQQLADMLRSDSGGGPVVTESSAMRVSAVYAGVELIAGAISTIPLRVYERSGGVNGTRKPADHPYAWLLNEQPHPDWSAAAFWEFFVASRPFRGDSFAELLRPSFRSSTVQSILPHHPDRVQPFYDTEMRKWYRVTPLVGPQYIVHPSDMIQIPSLGYDGLRSPSAITYAARQAVGTAMSANEYNERFFTNGARPDFAITTTGKLDKDQVEVLRATWAERHGGVTRSHLPAVLTGGLDVKQLSLSAADSRILEIVNYSIEDIARFLGVPPHMIGKTDKASSWGSGVANMGMGFVKFTLSRHLVKIRQEFNRKLWPMRERFYVDHDLTEIERGDVKSENEAFRIALGRAGEPGWLTQNEVRHAKNLPPVEGGNKLNDGSGAAAKPADDKTDPATTKDQTDEQTADTSGE